MFTGKPRFPVEIWAIIVEDLPPSSQRSCLSVSRLLHDIATQLLFSRISIDLCEREGSCTRDILDRIVSDRKFARLVKKLVVIAHDHRARCPPHEAPYAPYAVMKECG
jgi:hypothetical protein